MSGQTGQLDELIFVICFFAICHPSPTTWYDLQGKLGNWMSPTELEENVSKLFPGCMQGRTMYMIPFRCPMMLMIMRSTS